MARTPPLKAAQLSMKILFFENIYNAELPAFELTTIAPPDPQFVANPLL